LCAFVVRKAVYMDEKMSTQSPAPPDPCCTV
jgi:hypothetical protein